MGGLVWVLMVSKRGHFHISGEGTQCELREMSLVSENEPTLVGSFWQILLSGRLNIWVVMKGQPIWERLVFD